MSDSEEEDRRPIDHLDVSTLSAMHVELGLQPRCWVCGNSAWTIMSSPAGPAYGLPVAHDYVRVDVGLLITAYSLSCTRCGTIWLLSETFIRNWREAQAKNSSIEGET